MCFFFSFSVIEMTFTRKVKFIWMRIEIIRLENDIKFSEKPCTSQMISNILYIYIYIYACVSQKFCNILAHTDLQYVYQVSEPV